MTNKTYQINQIDLFGAILHELDRQSPGLPAKARYMNIVTQAADLIVAELARPDVVAEAGAGLEAWAASDRTGMSSKFMAQTLAKHMGMNIPFDSVRYSYPHDAADFDRCMHLITTVPAFESCLREMARTGPEWAAIVEHWPAWVALLEAELYRDLYWAMKEAYKH